MNIRTMNLIMQNVSLIMIRSYTRLFEEYLTVFCYSKTSVLSKCNMTIITAIFSSNIFSDDCDNSVLSIYANSLCFFPNIPLSCRYSRTYLKVQTSFHLKTIFKETPKLFYWFRYTPDTYFFLLNAHHWRHS